MNREQLFKNVKITDTLTGEQLPPCGIYYNKWTNNWFFYSAETGDVLLATQKDIFKWEEERKKELKKEQLASFTTEELLSEISNRNR